MVPIALVMRAQCAHKKNSCTSGINNAPRIDGAKVKSASGPWPQHHLRLLHRATYRPHLHRNRHCNPPMLRLRKEAHRSSSLEEAFAFAGSLPQLSVSGSSTRLSPFRDFIVESVLLFRCPMPSSTLLSLPTDGSHQQ